MSFTQTLKKVLSGPIAYNDFINFGGEQGCKDAGKVRQEGKDYSVRDGEILLFKFNV